MRLVASFFVLFAVLVGSSADQVHAQHDATPSDLSVAADPLGSIRAALRDGEASVAARLARERLAANRRDIEARVLLAQALIALEEPDYPAALAEVDRVVLRHDEHVDAQHTRLRILRAYKPRSWPPAEWRFAKQDLARKVLRLDPGNHTAHVELGVQAAQEAERFHNGVKLGRGMYATPANFGTRFDETAARSVEILDDTQREDFLWQFDLDLLESQGIAIVSYEGRAESAQAEAERYLGAALRIDGSDLEPVRLLLANRLVRDQLSPSDSLLTLLASQRPEDPTPWWIRGHLLYNGRDLAGASAAFEEALHRTDTTSQRLLRSPALVVADEASARMLSDSAYAEATWAALDPRRLSSLNERRLEHYARVAFADVVYGGPNYGGRRGWETEPGRTHIRYGPPNETVQFIPDLSGDGVLARSYPMMVWTYDDFRVVFDTERFNRDYRYYSPSMDELASSPRASLHDYVLQMDRRIREEPECSQYAPLRRVEVPVLASVFRGTEGQADVVVPLGVPVTTRPDADPLPLALRTGVYLLEDGVARAEAEVNRATLPRAMIRPVDALGTGGLFVDVPVLRVPPGSYTLAIEFEAAEGRVAGYEREPLVVPSPGPGLALSDLLLAYRIEETEPGQTPSPARLVRNGYEIDVAPWAVFRRDQPVYLYAESYGLTAEADGQAVLLVEAVLTPEDDRSGLRRFLDGLLRAEEVEGVAAQFEMRTSAGAEAHDLRLDISTLDPGAYVLTFRVTNAGRSATAERRLVIE